MNLENYKNKYVKFGTVMVPFENSNCPLTSEDIDELSNCCEKVEKEFVSIGDAGEKNFVHVGRFMTDIKKPEVVKNNFSEKVINILSKVTIKKFIKSVIGCDEELFYRRIQFNQIDKDCFVGYHLDKDSNPDYLAACVIQLGKDYDGGLYRVYQRSEKKYIDYKPPFASLIISNCDFPHEVTKVEKGNRKSLVFFVSKENGLNKRNL